MEALMLTVILLVVILFFTAHKEQVGAKDYKSAILRTNLDIEIALERAGKLKGQNPDEERQILFALEHLRIARASLCYCRQLIRGEHPGASRPGEVAWALGASELALTFAERRVFAYEMLSA